MRQAFIAFSRFIVRQWLKLYVRVCVIDPEHVPEEGGTIIACNHVSAIDPLIIGTTIRRTFRYMAKKELFSVPVLATLLRLYYVVPVDRGGLSLGAVRQVRDALRAGEAIVIFPEGTRSRDGRLGPAKEGVGMLAAQAGATIVPAHISGLYGRKLRAGRRFDIGLRFGPAIDPQIYLRGQINRRECYARITSVVLQAMAALEEANMPDSTEVAKEPSSVVSAGGEIQ